MKEISRKETPHHFDLRKFDSITVSSVDTKKIAEICRVVRGLLFTAINGAKSGHPGGSSSKVELLVTLLCSGIFHFDISKPKHAGRDRLVWSAGHCSPLAHSLNALAYRVWSDENVFSEEILEHIIQTEHLAKFRTLGGPSGHIESHYAFEDASTGSSGHGLSDALGRALLFKSCGLPMKVFCVMGDAETEEGMTYEARNLAARNNVSNLIVLLDRNNFGIDGHTNEVISTDIADHWKMMGWNVIELDGHNVHHLAYAFNRCLTDETERPTVIISHTTKGAHYGKLENTNVSHGSPLPADDYVGVMKALGFEVTGKDTGADINAVLDSFDVEARKYFAEALKPNVLSEVKLEETMKCALKTRWMTDHHCLVRPDELPSELVFKEGVPKATRFASEAFFKWMMENNNFFYVGTGDLSGSILTKKAEEVRGIISPNNPYGRGIRFGIAEQNMAMMMVAMSQETLPFGFKPMTAFGSYGVFTSMMANSVRMGLVNNAMCPENKGFFIMLAAHDGPETGEDGPTHHGLFWMSLFTAYPGIKVYKPLDANEAVEMLFHACEMDEPVAFSVARPDTPVFVRNEETGIPPAREAVNGAYVFKKYSYNKKKKLPIVVSGGQVIANLLTALPEIEKTYDVKIIAVTSPELFEEFAKIDPWKAEEIFSDYDRRNAIAIHNGWPGFLYPFLLPGDYEDRAIGIKKFLASGRPAEIYLQAGLDPQGIADKILNR